jgi:hypothetical protein
MVRRALSSCAPNNIVLGKIPQSMHPKFRITNILKYHVWVTNVEDRMFIPRRVRADRVQYNNTGLFIETGWQICLYMIPVFLPIY